MNTKAIFITFFVFLFLFSSIATIANVSAGTSLKSSNNVINRDITLTPSNTFFIKSESMHKGLTANFNGVESYYWVATIRTGDNSSSYSSNFIIDLSEQTFHSWCAGFIVIFRDLEVTPDTVGGQGYTLPYYTPSGEAKDDTLVVLNAPVFPSHTYYLFIGESYVGVKFQGKYNLPFWWDASIASTWKNVRLTGSYTVTSTDVKLTGSTTKAQISPVGTGWGADKRFPDIDSEATEVIKVNLGTSSGTTYITFNCFYRVNAFVTSVGKYVTLKFKFTTDSLNVLNVQTDTWENIASFSTYYLTSIIVTFHFNPGSIASEGNTITADIQFTSNADTSINNGLIGASYHDYMTAHFQPLTGKVYAVTLQPEGASDYIWVMGGGIYSISYNPINSVQSYTLPANSNSDFLSVISYNDQYTKNHLLFGVEHNSNLIPVLAYNYTVYSLGMNGSFIQIYKKNYVWNKQMRLIVDISLRDWSKNYNTLYVRIQIPRLYFGASYNGSAYLPYYFVRWGDLSTNDTYFGVAMSKVSTTNIVIYRLINVVPGATGAYQNTLIAGKNYTFSFQAMNELKKNYTTYVYINQGNQWALMQTFYNNNTTAHYVVDYKFNAYGSSVSFLVFASNESYNASAVVEAYPDYVYYYAIYDINSLPFIQIRFNYQNNKNYDTINVTIKFNDNIVAYGQTSREKGVMDVFLNATVYQHTIRIIIKVAGSEILNRTLYVDAHYYEFTINVKERKATPGGTIVPATPQTKMWGMLIYAGMVIGIGAFLSSKLRIGLIETVLILAVIVGFIFYAIGLMDIWVTLLMGFLAALYFVFSARRGGGF